MTESSDAGTVITGAQDIERFMRLSQRMALALEVRGMKRRGRSVRAIANEAMGTDIKTTAATYDAFDAWCVANYGLPPRPRPKDVK